MDYSLIENREAFNELYWAARPPEVRKLREMGNITPQRTSAAVELAKAGHRIDVMIEAYGFEPWGTMSGRVLNGFKWSPALFQNITLVPFPLNPWEVGPTSPMPAGAIKVSFEAADYPPFDKPAPLPAGINPVGPLVYGNVYACGLGDNQPIGAEFTDARGTFKKFGKNFGSIFGGTAWWEKVA